MIEIREIRKAKENPPAPAASKKEQPAPEKKVIKSKAIPYTPKGQKKQPFLYQAIALVTGTLTFDENSTRMFIACGDGSELRVKTINSRAAGYVCRRAANGNLTGRYLLWPMWVDAGYMMAGVKEADEEADELKVCGKFGGIDEQGKLLIEVRRNVTAKAGAHTFRVAIAPMQDLPDWQIGQWVSAVSRRSGNEWIWHGEQGDLLPSKKQAKETETNDN